MQKGGAVYIMCSPNKGVLYVGVTSDLPGRVYQHQNKIYPDSFTARYNCVMLVFFKFFDSIEEAIAEEKRIKDRKRKHKEDLIDGFNPTWKDLSEEALNYIR